jgi:hypothetical protein
VVAQVTGAGGAPLAGANGYSMDAVIGQNNAALLAGTNGLSLAIGFWYVAEQGGATQLIFQNGFEASGP